MKILILSISKYGSTHEVASFVSERLELYGYEISTQKFKENMEIDFGLYDVVVLGSPVYNDGMMKGLVNLVKENQEVLKSKIVALFTVALQKTPVFARGRVHGGIHYMNELFEILGDSISHADILLGELVPERLNKEDYDMLMRFYGPMATEKMKPRTLISKSDCWEYSEKLSAKLKRRS